MSEPVLCDDVGYRVREEGEKERESQRTIVPTSQGVPGLTLHTDRMILDAAQCTMSAVYCTEAGEGWFDAGQIREHWDEQAKR